MNILITIFILILLGIMLHTEFTRPEIVGVGGGEFIPNSLWLIFAASPGLAIFTVFAIVIGLAALVALFFGKKE